MLNFKKINFRKKIGHKTVSLLLIAVFIAGLLGNFALLIYIMAKKNSLIAGVNLNGIKSAAIKTVSAKEIYPLFLCPCCGQTIDADCCPMARERKALVEELVKKNLTEEQIISAYVKNYGLNSFADKNKRDEFKRRLTASAPADRPVISLVPDSLDLGEVSQKQGAVTVLFTLKNTGRTDLVINKLETSCGCTSASIIYQGAEGPIFSMPGHGVSETVKDWQAAIPAGETALLKVYYDPNTHKDFRGQAIREIYVYSNDPVNFEAKVKIELNQVD